MKIQSVNLTDIAKEAGVSKITVSRALRGQASVAKATRKKVEEAAARLGYQPNPYVSAFASLIRKQKGPAASCNLAWLNSANERDDLYAKPWARPFYDGARARAQQLGYGLDEIWIREPGMKPKRLNDILQARGIEGFVLPSPFVNEKLFTDTERYAIAVIGSLEAPFQAHRVVSNYHQNMVVAFENALRLGYKRPGLYLDEFVIYESQGALLSAFFLGQSGVQLEDRVPPLVQRTVHGDTDMETRLGPFRDWYLREKPDVILFKHGIVGELLKACGVAVPEDCGLIHLGLAEDVAGFTGIEENRFEQGRTAVDLIHSQLMRNDRGVPEFPRRIALQGSWSEGSTTRVLDPDQAKPRVRDCHELWVQGTRFAKARLGRYMTP